MSQEIELLSEIRDLLQVMAEPALAQRDAKRRSSLLATVGGSSKKAKAILLMDGSQTQAQIAKATGFDQGNLSRLVKTLAAEQLIAADQKHPKLTLKVPSNFFERGSSNE